MEVLCLEYQNGVSNHYISNYICNTVLFIVDIQSQQKLDSAAEDTAELILFMDKLFDSINANSKIAPKSKPLKGGVTRASGHEEFWKEAIQILKTMKFYCPKRKTFVKTPSIENFILTLEGFLYIRNILLNRNFNYFLTRRFNQDALENFFGCIRGHGVRNVPPNATNF